MEIFDTVHLLLTPNQAFLVIEGLSLVKF